MKGEKYMIINDITLNFLDKFYPFYEWLDDDNIEIFEKVFVYKVRPNILQDLINNVIKIDLKYTRDGIDIIGTRLDAIEKTQSRVGENIAKINEHLLRTDARLDKVEKRIEELEKYHMKGEEE